MPKRSSPNLPEMNQKELKEKKNGWIEQTGDVHPPPKKKKESSCLTHYVRSRVILAGRFVILGARFSVDALYRGAKSQRG
jgi:hypothetical protein